MKHIKVIQAGLGPIGQKIVQYMAERESIQIVGAVDPAVDKAGKNLAQICSLESDPGITISPDIASAVKDVKPDVALLTTVSSFKECVPQAQEIVKHGINVISTCEEMANPWQTEPELAKQLDEAAKKYGVAVLGTGVNPGFLMDFLPVVMTAVSKDVTSVKVSRLQDATYRRIPFQQKIGVALTTEEFEAKKQSGTLRHVGLTESMHMIASAFGWKLDSTDDVISPIIADKEITSGYKKVEPGMAAGVQQIGTGYVDGKGVIELIFRASVGEANPADTIEIKGTPDVTSTIKGGVNGDIATCAITVNAIKSIVAAAPGLRIMTDIPAVSFFESLG